jgi:hypothetical protein
MSFTTHAPATRVIVVRGIVADSVTGHRLDQARLIAGLGNPSAVSSAVGEYLLNIPLADGDTAVELRATRVGYVRQSCTARLSRDTIRADFLLHPATLHVHEVTLTKHGPIVDEFESGPANARVPTDSAPHRQPCSAVASRRIP